MTLAAVTLLTPLGIAAVLRPDPSGKGTHRQLGLPECTFVTLTGVRCPSCGMTTAWSNVMHGRPAAALRASAGGTLLAVLAMVGGIGALATAASGRSLVRPPGDSLKVTAGLMLVGLILAEWVMRLAAGYWQP
jgi:hypothetical protein